MWLPIKPEDFNKAMKFADDTVHDTYDRMKYNNIEDCHFHIYVGKIVEWNVCRYLQEELKLSITENTAEGEPDEFDFSFEHQGQPLKGDIKSCNVYRTWRNRTRTPEEAENEAPALVPVDQFKGQRKDLYIFTVILGNKLRETGGRYFLPRDAGICVIRWATGTDIDTWRFIPKGTKIFPYNYGYGTRTNNYGQKISECRPMEDFLDYLNFLPPF